VAFFAAGALAFAAVGASAQEGPSARAVVHASATIVSPVAIQTPSALRLVGEGSAMALEGTMEVRSPAPHVVAANARSWSSSTTSGFAPVRKGSWGTTPQAVRVSATPAASGETVHVTYVVAVIL
jgi:hypothetical protein